MRYKDFEIWISKPRMFTYVYACLGNTRAAISLYKANIRLSHAIFSIMGLFEITLRNAIDAHYSHRWGNNWLYDAAQPGGFLRTKGCERSLESVKAKIFPSRPFATNHTAVFNILSGIGRLRNRIAHHEPICFEFPFDISAHYPLEKYDQILDLFRWLGIKPSSFLFGIDHVHKEADCIKTLSKPFNIFLILE